MKELLINFARWPAAILWICFLGPWLARVFGIPVRAVFWKPEHQTQQLTRTQIVWAYGVLVFGIGLSIFNLDSETLHRVLSEENWSAKLMSLGFQIALSTFMGIVIAFWCAPTQNNESPVTKLDLSDPL